jgi:hypothetical protein
MRRLAKHDTLRNHSLPLAPLAHRGRLDCDTNNTYKERKVIMNQSQLEKYLTRFNKRLRDRYNRNQDFRLSKDEGRKLNIQARKRLAKRAKEKLA